MIDELTPLQQARREKILNAALSIFSTVGYYKAEMSVIAQESEVGKGTLYRYFKNKEDLFLQTVENQTNQLYEYIFHKIKPIEDPKEFLNQFFENIVNYCSENSKSFDILYLSSSSMLNKASKIIDRVRKSYAEKLSDRFVNWKEKGLIHSVNKDIVIDITSFCMFFLMYEFHYRKNFSIQEIKENMTRLFSFGLLSRKYYQEEGLA